MADAKYLQGFKSNPNQTYYEKNPIPKGKKEEYKRIAESEGKSLNQFIIDAINEKIERC